MQPHTCMPRPALAAAAGALRRPCRMCMARRRPACCRAAAAGAAVPEENGPSRGDQSGASSSSSNDRCRACMASSELSHDCMHDRGGACGADISRHPACACRGPGESEALPENFCIIESRESVRVSLAKATPCTVATAVTQAADKRHLSSDTHQRACVDVHQLLDLEHALRAGLCKATTGGDRGGNQRTAQQDLPAHGGGPAAAHPAAHQGALASPTSPRHSP